MSRLLHLARAVVWLAPAGRAKNGLLRTLGHRVHPDAVARASLVWRVDALTLGAGARLGRHNLLRDLREVVVEEGASIGRMNVITAHPAFARNPGSGRLHVAPHGKITSRHSIDCSAAVTVGAYSSIAGRSSTLMTHSVDLAIDAQRALPITIGERSFVGTHAVVLGGASLPARSVLGAGGLLLPGLPDDKPGGLFAGVPARRRADVTGRWFERTGTHTRHIVRVDRKSTRLNSSHRMPSRMPSSA